MVPVICVPSTGTHINAMYDAYSTQHFVPGTHTDDMHMILFVRRIPLVVHPLYDLYVYTPVLPVLE